MNRRSEIARKHKSGPGPMKDKLPLTLFTVSTASRAVDRVTGQNQNKSATAVESDYRGSDSDFGSF